MTSHAKFAREWQCGWRGVMLCAGLLHCSSTDAPFISPPSLAGAASIGGAQSAGVAGAAQAGAAAVMAGAGAVGVSSAGAGQGGTDLGAGGVLAAAGTASAAGSSGGAAGASGAAAGACSNPNWKFCDDFEKYPLGSVPNGDFYPYAANNKVAMGAAIATTNDRKVSGSQSVKFHVDNTGRSFLETNKPFPMAGNAFYGRMMIYLAQAPQGAVHWDIVSAYGKGGPEDGGTGNYRWGGMFGHTMANYHPGDPAVNVDNQHPKAGQWLCYEWMFDGPARRLQVWIDDYDKKGTSHGDINPMSWKAPEPFLTLQVGWAHYQTEQKGGDAWIDDLVIDDQRIGCPERASVP